MNYCGIDVAKRKHSAMVLNTKSETVKQNFTFKNDRQGFDTLLHELEPFAEQLLIALEATGHYWLSLYEVLTSTVYQVVVLNPLQVHAYQRSGIRKRKNDRIDSFWIADFARISNPQATKQQAAEHLQLRDLSRFRFRLTENMGNCKRKILSILDRVFPEYEKLFSNVFLTSSRQLLVQAVGGQGLVHRHEYRYCNDYQDDDRLDKILLFFILCLLSCWLAWDRIPAPANNLVIPLFVFAHSPIWMTLPEEFVDAFTVGFPR